jgi:hypothetical protein
MLSTCFWFRSIAVDPDPHHFGNLYPDPHQGNKPDPDPQKKAGSASGFRIRIKVKSWIGIHIK